LNRRILIIIAACFIAIIGIVWCWVHLGTWLAAAEAPQAADVIVCLSGKGREEKAAQLYQQGWAPKVILTVSKNKKSLTDFGVPEDRIILAPGPKTTFQEALMVFPILKRMGVRSILVVSDPFHLRRVRWTFHHVIKGSRVRMVFTSTDLPWPGAQWWKDKQAKFYTYSEISKLGWYWVSHGLLNRNEDPPWAINLKHRYEKWLLKCLS
jgi:uncharacterized SAM-binding protein YcdF (DUF218 family)